MVIFKVKEKATWEKPGDYVVSEISEHFHPLPGSSQGIWEKAGERRISEMREDEPMIDYEIIKTSAFQLGGIFPGGILHLKLPRFPPSNQEESNKRLSQCYNAVLNKAVEEKAKTIVFPFIGCISVKFNVQQGIDIALRTIHQFISGSNTGKLEVIYLCTSSKSMYKLAIKNDVYIQEKKSHYKTVKKSIVPRIEEGSCIFRILDPTFDSYRSNFVDCSNQLEKLSELSCREPLYGCKHAVDLLLLRGGIQIDWTDEIKSRSVFDMLVCMEHKKMFITDWNFNILINLKNSKRNLTCSIPEVRLCLSFNIFAYVNGINHFYVTHNGGKRPETTKRLNKSDTLDYISSTGRFLQVGTAVCSTHITAIKERKYDKLSFSNEAGQESRPEEFMDMFDLQQSLSEVESTQPNQGDASFEMIVDSSVADESMDSLTERVPPPPEAYRDDSESQRLRAVRDITTLFGLDRLTGRKSLSWKTLQPDTRRKKINGMINLHNELYKACAGDCWEEMKDACLRKMKIVEKDARVERVMDAVGQCLEDSNEKSVRIGVLKLLTSIFTEKEARSSPGTGASRYLIRAAKLSSFEELRAITSSFKRERFNKPKVFLFLRFLARPEILKQLPNSCKKVTIGNGSEVAIAAVARMYSYREIYRLFIRYCEDLARLKGLVSRSDIDEFVRVNALGYSTAYKLMEVLAPIRLLRMSCCDSFQADAFEAYDNLSLIVDELALLNEIDLEKTMDLRRRIRVSKNFIFGEMRLHFVKESDVISHCWNHALSDKDDPRFSSPCNHSHDKTCTECNEAMSLPTIMKRIVSIPNEIAKNNGNIIRYRLGRMLQIIAESDGLIKSYRKHLIRCVASEYDRRRTIDSLEDGHAMIVADYAMKVLPTDAIERQSQWFAKGGISFHMSATIARIGGELASHEFSHISSVSKQDSSAVAGILEHVFSTLKENGITHIHLRTDNAANYHNVALIAYLLHLADKLKIVVLSHIFSEPQFGKGRADRAISLAKGKLNSYIDSGKSACTPQEIINGFVHNILLKGCSYYLIEVTPQSPKSNAELGGIKKFSSFKFENHGVRVRRHDAIGEGMLVKREKLPPFVIKPTIHRKEGYLSQSEHFWKSIGTTKDDVEEEVKETESDKLEENVTKEYLRCPDLLCPSRFKTERGLERHVTLGNHKYYKETESVTDFGAQVFSDLLETTEEAQMAVQCDSIVPLCHGDNSDEREIGYALRKPEIRPILPKVKKEVEGMILKQLDMDRRAEAREIKEELRELKNPNGSYRFDIEFCLTESQVKSQITRVVNLRKKTSGGKGLGKDDTGQIDTPDRGRKRKQKQVEKGAKTKAVGKPSKKSREVIEEEEELDDEEEVDTDDEGKEERMEEKEEELDIVGIMNQIVEENRHAIFDDSDEFEDEL